MMANLQIRNVPEDLHESLHRWAAEANTSVSALVLRQLKQLVALRTFEQELRSQPMTDTPQDTVSALQAERDSR